MLFSLVLLTLAAVQDVESVSPFDTSFLTRALDTVHQGLDQGGAEFWGNPWAGQVMVVDPPSRYGACSVSPGEGLFTPLGSVWVGRIPTGPNLEKAQIHWAGQTWNLVPYPQAKDPQLAAIEIFATLWKNQVSEQDFSPASPPLPHLKTLDGRLWLRLEWQALSKALTTEGITQRGAVADALAFRRFRRGLSPNLATYERTVEWVAGLGTYTGICLSGIPEPRTFLRQQLQNHAVNGRFEEGLAWTASAYGLLLDEHRPDWRTQLNPNQDLALMLEIGMKLILPKAWYDATKLRAQGYRIQSIQREESERLLQEEARRDMLLAPFTKGAVLLLPVSAEDTSTYGKLLYESEIIGSFWTSVKMVAGWGKLEATDGFRRFEDHYYLPLPLTEKEGVLSGKEWRLILNAHWQPGPGPRNGDLILQKIPKKVP